MAKEKQVPSDEPKQKTRKGKEIPLPKREQVMADFKKIVKGKKPPRRFSSRPTERSAMQLADLGISYREQDWPYGLMCCGCPHIFREGERFTTDLYAFSEDIPMVRVLCVACVTASDSAPEPPEPRA